MLTFQEYTTAIDVWSVGCILAEMLSGDLYSLVEIIIINYG